MQLATVTGGNQSYWCLFWIWYFIIMLHRAVQSCGYFGAVTQTGIFITNRLQNYFAMINRNLNLDKKFAIVSYHMIEVKVPFSDLLIRTIHVTWNMKEFSRKTCFF